MLFLEEYARWLLVVHTLVALALVAASTHLVVWMRGYPRGRFHRHRGARRFAVIAACLYVATFLLGNLLYPVYKIRVRTEYLDSGTAAVSDQRARNANRSRARQQYNELRTLRGEMPLGADEPRDAAGDDPAALPRATAKIARWFDVKEHWVALGMALSVACAFILSVWDPRKAGAAVAPVVFGLAAGAAASSWLGAIIGIVVSSYRSVGAPG